MKGRFPVFHEGDGREVGTKEIDIASHIDLHIDVVEGEEHVVTVNHDEVLICLKKDGRVAYRLEVPLNLVIHNCKEESEER